MTSPTQGEVRRYDIRSYNSGFPPLVLDRAAGAWVSFDDHAATVARLQAELSAAKASEQRLAEALERIGRQFRRAYDLQPYQVREMATWVDAAISARQSKP